MDDFRHITNRLDDPNISSAERSQLEAEALAMRDALKKCDVDDGLSQSASGERVGKVGQRSWRPRSFIAGFAVCAVLAMACAGVLLFLAANHAAIAEADAAAVSAHAQALIAAEDGERMQRTDVHRLSLQSDRNRVFPVATKAEASTRLAAELYRIAADKANAVVASRSNEAARQVWTQRREAYLTMAKSFDEALVGYTECLKELGPGDDTAERRLRLYSANSSLLLADANRQLVEAHRLAVAAESAKSYEIVPRAPVVLRTEPARIQLLNSSKLPKSKSEVVTALSFRGFMLDEIKSPPMGSTTFKVRGTTTEIKFIERSAGLRSMVVYLSPAEPSTRSAQGLKALEVACDIVLGITVEASHSAVAQALDDLAKDTRGPLHLVGFANHNAIVTVSDQADGRKAFTFMPTLSLDN